MNHSKGRGGVRGAITSVFTLVVLAAIVTGWARVNDIDSPAKAYDYFKAWSDKGQECAQDDSGKCKETIEKVDRAVDERVVSEQGGSGSSNTNGSSGTTGSSNNSGNASGSNGSDGPKTPSDPFDTKEKVQAAFDKLPTGKSKEGVKFVPSEWPHWIGEPCNTRDHLLKSLGKNVKVDDETCKATSGEWIDAYSGDKITNPNLVNVDMAITPRYAVEHGGDGWDAAKKQKFANDPANLFIVSQESVEKREGKSASDFMPKGDRACSVSKAWTVMSSKYGVTMTEDDKKAVRSGLRKC